MPPFTYGGQSRFVLLAAKNSVGKSWQKDQDEQEVEGSDCMRDPDPQALHPSPALPQASLIETIAITRGAGWMGVGLSDPFHSQQR